MKPRIYGPRATGTALALVIGAMIGQQPAHAGEIFGSGNTGASTFIPANDFKQIFNNCDLVYSTNNFWKQDTGCGSNAYYATLSLPEGARILRYRTSYRDNDATYNIGVSLRRALAPLTPGTTVTTQIVSGSTFTSSGPSTDYVMPSQTVGHTYDTWDGTHHASYFVRAQMPLATADVTFRGVWIIWARQIPPAPASATFSDVGTTHPFFNEVQQLAKSGVTGGCGGGNFCPDAAVSRGQMATFLTRALGLHWDFNTNPAE